LVGVGPPSGGWLGKYGPTPVGAKAQGDSLIRTRGARRKQGGKWLGLVLREGTALVAVGKLLGFSWARSVGKK